jgi:hypothetical protein
MVVPVAFGTASLSIFAAEHEPVLSLAASCRITDEIVRVGINYHFAGGPVVAKH